MQVIIEIPYCFAQTIIYVFIIYGMIGLDRNISKFFWFMYFTFFSLLYYTYYGMMVVAISPNQSVASVTSTIFYSLWSLFSGFLIPKTVSPFHPPLSYCSGHQCIVYIHNIGGVNDRGYQYGGDGTTGHARLHGHYTDCSFRNSETWRASLRMANQ